MQNFKYKTNYDASLGQWWNSGGELSAGGTIVKWEADNLTDSLQKRKLQALDFICDYGDCTLSTAMAILERKQEMTGKALEIMETGIQILEEGGECSDTNLALALLLITRYRNYLSEEMYARIKKSILNFRYGMDETGDDVFWYFADNHVMLLELGQYLAGYLFGEEIFAASSRLGTKQYEIGKKKLEEWFSVFENYGYEEWNSVIHIPVYLIGFFILYSMAPDQNIYESAKKALDFTFKITDYNSFAGIMSSSYGRAYEEGLKARQFVEPNFLTWISYGEGYMTNTCRAASLYCLSDYIPKFYREELMLKDREWMSAELDQGTNHVKTYFYKTRDYFIASVRRFKPFVHGHQQHLMNVALGSKGVQYYINHPKELSSGEGNPPGYWAGNGTIPYIEQYKNVIVMIYRIDPEETVHYIHAFTPFCELDEYEITDHWLFIRVEDSYMGTYFSNGLRICISGVNRDSEIISEGLNHGLIIKCGSQEEYRDFEHFKDTLERMEIAYDGYEQIRFHDFQYGAIELKNLQNVMVDGLPMGYKYKQEMDVRKGMLP